MDDFDRRLAMMCGSDVPIPSCQIVAHQPILEEISMIGEKVFFSGAQTLCLHKEMFIEDRNLLLTTTNFQIFMMIMQEKETADKKEAVKQLFSLIFPKQQLLITPRSIILRDSDVSITIDEKNFEALQKIANEIFCINTGPMETRAFNPQGKKAKEIADKLMRARQRVAEQKAEGSIFSQYISTLTVGLNSMSIFDCENLTMYQLFDLVERYMLYVNWDLDIKSRLAGGSSDKQPDNWMKNIH